MRVPQTIVRKALLTACLERAKAVERIEIKQIDLAPRQQSGLHTHPCPVVGYAVSGTVRFQIEGRRSRRYVPATPFSSRPWQRSGTSTTLRPTSP
jgi:quercetin dioxygenase-like cupin family protein